MTAIADSGNLGIERREYPRAQAAQQITYERFDARGVKVAEGNAVTINLSERGALIETPRDLGIEGSLIVCVLTPFYVGIFRGRVVHSHQMTNQLFRAGIQLTEVIEGRWDAMQALVNHALEERNE